MTSAAITERDVLTRARAILAAGPLAGVYAVCGAFCPWCAIAQAKTELDREAGRTLLDNIAGGDAPLIFARMALKRFCDLDTHTTSQEQALEIFDRILS